jgi:hypothetical protein
MLHLSQIFRRTSVSVRRLNHADLDLGIEVSRLDQVNNEPCYEGRDLVSVQHAKLVPLVDVEIHQPVRIAIETTASLASLEVVAQGRR